MSEMVQRAALAMLANETPARLANVLKSHKQAAEHLKTGFLPAQWSRDNEAELAPNLSPDSPEAAEAAEVESETEDKAGKAWASLPQEKRANLLEAVKFLSPASGAESDLRRMLEQIQPTEMPG